MSVAATESRALPESIPGRIESPTGKLVYLYLATAGRATVGEMAERLDEPKIALYDVLGTLSKRGVVERTDGGYRLA